MVLEVVILVLFVVREIDFLFLVVFMHVWAVGFVAVLACEEDIAIFSTAVAASDDSSLVFEFK